MRQKRAGVALPPPQDDAQLRVLQIVRELAAQLHPEARGIAELAGDASLERDFGLDSLARVELALRIEAEFAIELSEEAISSAETPLDLAHALRRTTPAPRAVQVPTPPPGPVAAEAFSLPASVKTLIEALEWHAHRHPSRVHVRFVDQPPERQLLTFGGLRHEALTVAAGLRQRGLAPGDRVAIMLPTGREFFAAFYGVIYASAVPVPLYPPARATQLESHLRRLAAILANSQATMLLAVERAKPFAPLLRAAAPTLNAVLSLREIASPDAEAPAPSPAASDIAFLQYTSGSTGQPKGVVLTHANLLANLRAMQSATRAEPRDCFVSWLPLYHDMGLIGACIGSMLFGFPLVLMSPLAFLTHPLRWLRTVHEHRATMTAAPNFAYEICLSKIPPQEIEALDLSCLRLMFNGAEAVSADTLERFIERFAPCGLTPEALMPVYGLAECALGLTFPPLRRGPRIERLRRERLQRAGIAEPASAEDTTALRVVSCGAPIPGHLVRIVDAHGVVLAERTQGRIQFKGPSATSGYFRNEAATAQLFEEGWLNTGDLGFLAGGELYITGREKDIIIRGGQNIHPQELEETIAQLPGVRKGGVAVFPAVDRRIGTERIVVLAETRETAHHRRERLQEQIRRLAVDLLGMPIDEIVLAPPRTVLKTSSGKIRRAACREAYERRELGRAPRAAWRQVSRLFLRSLSLRLARTTRRLGELLWSVRALLTAAVLAPVIWTAAVSLPGLKRRRTVAQRLSRFALRMAGAQPRVTWHTSPARAPQVFVANHASYLDSVLLTAVLPPDAAFVAKRELTRVIVLGTLLKRLGCVFVERRDAHQARADARQLESRLRAGESLVVFAEGTFRRDPGLLPFRMGAFLAAATSAVPVIPVAIRGTRLMLPDGAYLPRRAQLEVLTCEPLISPASGWDAAVSLRDRARACIRAHIDEPDLERAPRSEPLP